MEPMASRFGFFDVSEETRDSDGVQHERSMQQKELVLDVRGQMVGKRVLQLCEGRDQHQRGDPPRKHGGEN